MLGWFKKKLGTKDPADQLLQEEEVQEELVDDGAASQKVTTCEPEGDVASRTGGAEEPEKGTSMFRRLQERLGKTRSGLVERLDSLFLGKKEIDQELLDDLEELLITADLGVGTVQDLLDAARSEVKRGELSDPRVLKRFLREKVLAYLQLADQAAELVMPEKGPFVIMVIGVNGVGKTTTIGKVAAKFTRSGHSVLLIAGDTFRAAAIDQLKIWGERVGVEVVAQSPGSDPSSVVFDGIEYGAANDFDVIIMDTAGRLHTSVNLMEELKKIKRVAGKKLEGAPHEILLVLDSTTGQNAVSQAKLFNEAVDITGLALTKLDGTAKGGIVVNICRELQLPVRFIGIGEQIDDLRDFNPDEFVEALFHESAPQTETP
jgi:fused signal recognition particle receptor